jgi:hypothetical protein
MAFRGHRLDGRIPAFWGHRLLQQLRGPAVNRQFGLQLDDASPRRDELGLVAGADTGQLAGVDKLLPPPGVDRLVTI